MKIRQLTFHDDHQFRKIINLYIRDTREDLTSLETSLKAGDLGNSSLLFHRMAGRISLMGNEKLAFTLRKLEIDTRNGETPAREAMSALKDSIGSLIDFLEQENSNFVL